MFGFFKKGGAVGQTAEWVAMAFEAATSQGIIDISSSDTKAEIDKFINFALTARFQGDVQHPDYKVIVDRFNTSGLKGLCGFTTAILVVEAGFHKNSPDNVRKFTGIICDTIHGKGIDYKWIT